MKKLIALFLALVLCAGLVACGNTPAETSGSADALADAVAYVKTIYKKVAEVTSKDFERVGVVPVGTEKVEVVWTADVSEDLVKAVKNDNGMVTIDVNEECETETPYVLTATISYGGKSESLTWNHILPASVNLDAMSYTDIVELGYTLADGASLDDTFRLYGTISKIDTAWSDEYKNITVTIQVAGKEDKPIMCYRLSGEGAKDLKVGDAITVEGKLKNYKGTIEFDQGCVLVGMGEHPDQKALVEAAFALADGVSMDNPAVMTGVVSSVVSAWSDQYKNITVNFMAEGKELQAYRLSGTGAKDLKAGDTITVVGTLKNYKGTIEFDQGCVLIPNDAYQSAKTALSGYKLAEGASQETASTMTGTITKVDTAWSDEYKNITVTIQIGDLEAYQIMCYRLSGDGAKDLKVGDTITVTGTLKNYKGTIEFDQGCTLVK